MTADSRAPQRGYADVNGLRIYHEIHGTGRPLVLLHGGMLTVELAFGPLLAPLAERHQVIAVELQGHGRTADTAREMTLGALAADVAALLRHLNVDRADFLGYSLGGLVALELAVTRPELVSHLVLASAPYRPDGFHDLPPGSDRLPSEADRRAWEAAYREVAPDPDHFAALLARVTAMVAAFEGRTADELRSLRAPTLLVLGDHDFVRLAHAAEMLDLIPDAQLAVLPGTTHTDVTRRPEQLLALVLPFLAPAAPRSRPVQEPAEHSIGAALTAYLQVRLAELLTLDAAVRRDEPDAVHQMRITVRRLRSALTAHRRMLHRERTDPLGAELRLLGKILGRARDAEVLGERLTAQAAALPAAARPEELAERIRARFERRYTTAHRAALRTLDSPRYRALLDALAQTAAQPPLRQRASHGRGEARRVLRRERRRTGRRTRAAFGTPPGPDRDAALHQARKAAKRARYTAESILPLTGPAGSRYVLRMKELQQALGRHQDGVVAEQAVLTLLTDARAHGQDTFGYGLLYAAQRQDAEADLAAAEHAWHQASDGG
ncbi:alpha/beta fold hydrolase [Kitasatospora mediocidica]|uniref:alpha/beta fold hydrolase n=1 Tax=Kitasatospora mediocidica TaxID=58352 RepID=UPI0007C69DD9|nr:alpha/beta fold hydrolase [Kitasatospora mediocidica]